MPAAEERSARVVAEGPRVGVRSSRTFVFVLVLLEVLGGVLDELSPGERQGYGSRHMRGYCGFQTEHGKLKEASKGLR